MNQRVGKFEAANGGTLFLDEIGDLSLAAQARILRVLQERVVDRVGAQNPIPVDVRVIAATNKPLEQAIKERSFREDLYYRLRVVRVHIPSLREIPEDIPLIAKHFLDKHCGAEGLPAKELEPAAMEHIKHYPWPGNARQLENEMKRLIASVRGPRIRSDQLDLPCETVEAGNDVEEEALDDKTIDEVIGSIERRMIDRALKKHHWNKQKAAEALGLSRQGLGKKLKRLKIGG